MGTDVVRKVVSIGYEGRTLEEFVAEVLGSGVTVLADVRLNAISRKAGFSKTRLRQALAEVGIDYVHLAGLGNPRENREPFWSGQVEQGVKVFRALLDEPEPAAALEELKALRAGNVVAVMCFEADDYRCHRRVVVTELADGCDGAPPGTGEPGEPGDNSRGGPGAEDPALKTRR